MFNPPDVVDTYLLNVLDSSIHDHSDFQLSLGFWTIWHLLFWFGSWFQSPSEPDIALCNVLWHTTYILLCLISDWSYLWFATPVAGPAYRRNSWPNVPLKLRTLICSSNNVRCTKLVSWIITVLKNYTDSTSVTCGLKLSIPNAKILLTTRMAMGFFLENAWYVPPFQIIHKVLE